MGERFDPAAWLDKVFPKGIEKSGLLDGNLDIKKRYLKALVRATGQSGRKITAEVYKTVAFYAEKEAALKAAGERAFKQEALNGQTLLTTRLKNFLVYAEVQEQRKRHKGKMYRWLPSSAETPDPQHQLLYGKIFREGEGDKDGYMPGERWGCQCGIEWLDDEDIVLEMVEKEMPANFKKHIDFFFDYAEPKKDIKNLRLTFAKASKQDIKIAKKVIGRDISSFSHKLTAHDLQHIKKGHSGSNEVLRGQIPVDKTDIKRLPLVVKKPDSQTLANYKTREGRIVFVYEKRLGRFDYTYHASIGGKKTKEITPKTFYKRKRQK